MKKGCTVAAFLWLKEFSLEILSMDSVICHNARATIGKNCHISAKNEFIDF